MNTEEKCIFFRLEFGLVNTFIRRLYYPVCKTLLCKSDVCSGSRWVLYSL